MLDLPRPNVSITNDGYGKEQVVISRDNQSKSYSIEGSTEGQRIRGIVEKIIADHHTAEWLPKISRQPWYSVHHENEYLIGTIKISDVPFEYRHLYERCKKTLDGFYEVILSS